MVNFDLIRSTIVRGLYAYLGTPVIESDTAAEIPPYPFLTYNFITTGIVEGFPSMTVADSEDGNIIEHYSEQPTMTVSFNSYAIRKADSVTNAMRAQDWLRFIGHDELKQKANVVVVDVGDIHNRDVQVGDEWERRNGFDVDFRATNIVDAANTFIEKAEIRRG
ncbi:hypothetical protein HQN90_17800 [Paenibacillus alba]|uniref:phage neck terminator protein n=1 Tax=Paenibacillus alba TaxID=1197127 RepID=UPI001564645C|nr:hypothetical protein [Paenibacillus alba]NQX67979.1 hypothetical protein [Paenibacillus alba]